MYRFGKINNSKCIGRRFAAAYDIQITVAAAERIDELLRHALIAQRHTVLKLVERSHIRRFHLFEGEILQIRPEQIVEKSVVIEIFGNRYPQYADEGVARRRN